jgi:hypothetical protein
MANSIAIGMPLIECMFSRFFVGWTQLQGTEEIPKKFEVGNVIAGAYDKIARWFLEETDRDVLLTMEQDHLYPPNLFERVANYDLEQFPIVGAHYNTRAEPFQPVAGVPYPEHWNDADVWEGNWDPIRATPPWPSLDKAWRKEGKLQRVLFVGLGCTAISRRVLEDWPKDRPYFMDDYWGPLQVHRSCDVRFCHEAAKIGYPTFLDCGLRLPHMTVRPITDENHDAELRQQATRLGLAVP